MRVGPACILLNKRLYCLGSHDISAHFAISYGCTVKTIKMNSVFQVIKVVLHTFIDKLTRD